MIFEASYSLTVGRRDDLNLQSECSKRGSEKKWRKKLIHAQHGLRNFTGETLIKKSLLFIVVLVSSGNHITAPQGS